MTPVPVLLDPAFHYCLRSAVAQPELVSQFDRLNRTNLTRKGSNLDLAIDDASGRTQSEASAFVDFVYDCVYQRLEPSILDDLRTRAGGQKAA